MMNKQKTAFNGVIGARRGAFLASAVLILLVAAACQQIPRPNVTVPPGASATAAALSQQGAAAAATAAAIAGEQGAGAVATVQAMNTPDANAIRERVAAALPDEAGNVRVTISDSDLNRAIQAKQQLDAEAGQTSQSPLQNPVVAFSGGHIVLSGDVTQPVNGRLAVTFRPYAANGALQFEIVSATLGSVAVPPVVLQSAEATLNNTLGDALNALPASVQLKEIIMAEGSMTLVAGR